MNTVSNMYHDFLASFSLLIGICAGNKLVVDKNATIKWGNIIAIVTATVYFAAFVIGLFLGDLFTTHTIRLEPTIGLISTALTYTLGFSILYNMREKRRPWLLATATICLLSAQTALVFNIFATSMTSILYYLATTITLIFMYGLSSKTEHHERECQLNDRQNGFW